MVAQANKSWGSAPLLGAVIVILEYLLTIFGGVYFQNWGVLAPLLQCNHVLFTLTLWVVLKTAQAVTTMELQGPATPSLQLHLFTQQHKTQATELHPTKCFTIVNKKI